MTYHAKMPGTLLLAACGANDDVLRLRGGKFFSNVDCTACLTALRHGDVREPVSADPEVDDIYLCHVCGNDSHFIGIDEHGYGGPDECDGSCEQLCVCQCETRLTQHFQVLEGGEIDYHAFTGGGDDGEIGHYTTITCAVCSTVIYNEAPAVGTGLGDNSAKEVPKPS